MRTASETAPLGSEFVGSPFECRGRHRGRTYPTGGPGSRRRGSTGSQPRATAYVSEAGRGHSRGFGGISRRAEYRGRTRNRRRAPDASSLLLAALALAALALAALALAARADGFVYWSNNFGTIASANLDGTTANPSPVSVGAQVQVHGLAVDGSYIYWTNFQTGAIGRANLDGSGVTPSFIGASAPDGVAVENVRLLDELQRHHRTGQPQRHGSPAELHHRLRRPAGDHGRRHLYLLGQPFGTVGRANLDGTGVQQDFISGAPITGGRDLVLGVAVDSTSVYWSNFYSGTIGRANLNGTGINQNFITRAAEPVGVAVDSAHVYWANFRSEIGRANLDGSGVNQRFARADAPQAVAVDALAGSCAGQAATIVGTGGSDTLRSRAAPTWSPRRVATTR